VWVWMCEEAANRGGLFLHHEIQKLIVGIDDGAGPMLCWIAHNLANVLQISPIRTGYGPDTVSYT
jgi:hypothetical protein